MWVRVPPPAPYMDIRYGPVITTLPEGFIPREQWPEYDLKSEAPAFLAPRVVGKNPVGMYRRLWPIVIEDYISDTEPILADSDPYKISLNRALIWQRLNRTDIPRGWYCFSKTSNKLEGYAELFPNKEYWTAWSESARRYRRKWLHEYAATHTIERVSFEEFERAYVQSPVFKIVKRALIDIIKRKLEAQHSKNVELFCARDIQSKELIAGMATITSPTCKGSHYISGFVRPDIAPESAMVGLMDHWFSQSKERGIRFLSFGGFWTKGNPHNWKGFSEFKAKFGLFYIKFPPILIRFARGRLF